MAYDENQRSRHGPIWDLTKSKKTKTKFRNADSHRMRKGKRREAGSGKTQQDKTWGYYYKIKQELTKPKIQPWQSQTSALWISSFLPNSSKDIWYHDLWIYAEVLNQFQIFRICIFQWINIFQTLFNQLIT